MTPHRPIGALARILALATAAIVAACIPEKATLAPADAAVEHLVDASLAEAQPEAEASAEAEAEAAASCPGPCPTVIAEGFEEPWGIALDNTNVFWTDHSKSRVFSCPRSGCVGAPQAVTGNEPGASDIAQRGGMLAWTNTHVGQIRVCDPNGGCNPQTLAPDQTEPGHVSVSKDMIAWSNLGGGQIRAMMLGWPLGPFEVAAGEFRPGTIELTNNGQVYWVVQGSSAAASDSAIRFSTWTGEGFSQPTTIAEGLPGASGLTVSATHVFWTTLGSEKSSGRLHGVPRDLSSPPTVVAMNQDEPFAVAFQDSKLYWLNRGDGTVMECDAFACSSPKAIATGQTQPWSIAVDATGIFWTDRGARKVLMLPR